MESPAAVYTWVLEQGEQEAVAVLAEPCEVTQCASSRPEVMINTLIVL